MIAGTAKPTIIIVIFYELLVLVSSENSFESRQLSTGSILGRKLQTRVNTTAYVYLGIPYGEAPIGDLRYRAPVPKRAWSGQLDVQQYKAACLQNSSTDGNLANITVMSEDCLLMNVFTSENCLRLSESCSVLYYIHGGQWNYDSPTMFDVEFLTENFATEDLVLITVTYRLGSFGFFNTGKKTSVDKNAALLDVTEGLRWVQREVHIFGGDKNRVTIMGHSSGALMVDLLSLAPSTVGLFNQIVIMSATLDASTPKKDSNVLESRALAVKAGCARLSSSWDDDNDVEATLACMRSRNGRYLLLMQRELEEENFMFSGPSFDDENGFITDEIRVLQQNRKPYRCLAGTLSTEFSEMIKLGLIQSSTLNYQMLQITCEKMAESHGYRYVKEVGMACANDYSKRPNDIDSLMDDTLFFVPLYETGEGLRSKGASVFKYSFEYEDIGDALLKAFPIKLMHSFDLVYVMGLRAGKFTPKDEKIRKIYTSAFVNFAKTGDPSMINADKWQPTDDRNNYFKINFDENLKMPGNRNGYHADAVKFWTVTAKKLDDDLAANATRKLSVGIDLSATSWPSYLKLHSYVSAFAILQHLHSNSHRYLDHSVAFWPADSYGCGGTITLVGYDATYGGDFTTLSFKYYQSQPQNLFSISQRLKLLYVT
uniref:Carboxylic ester hydrolase n=1 Tax=Plectus sambesii TaxID=2011161 RepID=A0A914UNJ2_9BILA